MLLETPGILRKLSTLCIGPYPVTNEFKIASGYIVNILSVTRIYKHPSIV
jgi:hypothetical protein